MTAVRGPLGSIRERQSVKYQMYKGKYGRKRSLTSGNILESDFNGNDESLRGFITHLP